MKVNFVKMIACFFAGASMLVSCQKEDVVSPMEEDEAGVKYAEEVVVGQDKRDLGNRADWMGDNGKLNLLLEGVALPPRLPDLFADNGRLIPSGIQIGSEESFVYVTYVGNVAAFNNVLGYYYYDPAKEYVDSEVILNQIYRSTKKGIHFKNIIYDHTKDLEFGTTFKLSDNNGKKFKPGTVIGFCVMPNAGGDAYSIGKNRTKLPNVQMKDNNPIFIATDRDVNKDGAISHVVGQTACGDLVIGFEDLNSAYSTTSDQDFNDLVFLIGDNLDSRGSNNLIAYTCECDEALLWLLGDKCQTEYCGEETKVRLMSGNAGHEFKEESGWVTVSNDGEFLTVKYETSADWNVKTAAVYIPSVAPNQQNTDKGHALASGDRTSYDIPMDQVRALAVDGKIWIGAYAHLIPTKKGGNAQAWGEGILSNKGNLWMYFPYEIQDCK